ncbi:MAG: hypothetical protein NT031_09910 [Planctomycetota bacterium]|nr:hypothetical protein [Planctomycetota bacterium]
MNTRSKLISGMLAVVLGAACLASAADKPAILPTPKSIKLEGGTMPLTPAARIVITDPRLEIHAPVLAQELWLITGTCPKIVKGDAQAGDILLQIAHGHRHRPRRRRGLGLPGRLRRHRHRRPEHRRNAGQELHPQDDREGLAPG